MTVGGDQLKRHGYILHPQDDLKSGGSAALEFIIHPGVEQSIFSPQHVSLNVISREKTPENLRIFHPWTFQSEYCVTLGHVEMRASDDRKIVLFTFGGDLQIDNYDQYLTGIHRSPAPIFVLKEDINTVHNLFADQVMILLKTHSFAEEAAQRAIQKSLAGAHPLQLYISCLKTLQVKYKDHSRRSMPHVQDFVHFIQCEIKRMEVLKKNPGNIPLLDELLQAGGDSFGR